MTSAPIAGGDRVERTPEEWKEIAVNLGEKGIVTYLRRNELFAINGNPLLHGCL